ncbi:MULTISPECIES: hypothetical protein [unclassified Chitinophaga]|uniref:hypothetical protein n=1 Tax=unclassified Chitinophaga TaxID=2619133 RepID=UPI00300FE1D1
MINSDNPETIDNGISPEKIRHLFRKNQENNICACQWALGIKKGLRMMQAFSFMLMMILITIYLPDYYPLAVHLLERQPPALRHHLVLYDHL